MGGDHFRVAAVVGYTAAELAEIFREYSHLGMSPDESLALAEHLDRIVQAGEVVPPVSPTQAGEWRTYRTLPEAAEAAGLAYAEGLTEREREAAGWAYFQAVSDRWAVVEIEWGIAYLMRERGAK